MPCGFYRFRTEVIQGENNIEKLDINSTYKDKQMSDPNRKSPSVEEALDSLRFRLGDLEHQAEILCDQHFNFVMAENKRRTWAERSILYARPRARDNTLAINWFEVRWYGANSSKTRRMEKKVIIKPKSKHGYNMDTLIKRAQYWEVDMVTHIEEELISIRTEVSFIAKAIGQLNHIENTCRLVRCD